MERNKLIGAILSYWGECVQTNVGDFAINELMDDVIKGFGKSYIGDWDTTLQNLTNSQLRATLNVIQNSGIKEDPDFGYVKMHISNHLDAENIVRISGYYRGFPSRVIVKSGDKQIELYL